MAKHQEVRTALEQQLARLLQRAGKIEGDLRQTLDRDWPDQAAELENDEVLEGLDTLTLAEVRRIRAAIGRIDDGTYGVCVGCGLPIGEARLAALPATDLCVNCAGEARGTA